MKEFKAGDLVYCPSLGKGFYKLVSEDSDRYPVKAGGCTFTSLGRKYDSDEVQAIFRATPENKKLLDALYGVEFETPPKTLEQRLAQGERVLCKAWDVYESDCSYIVLSGYVGDTVFPYRAVRGVTAFKHAVETTLEEALGEK